MNHVIIKLISLKKDEEKEYYDELFKNIYSLFPSEFYDTSKIDNGEDEVMKTDKMKVIFISTTNQKNNNNENMTYIDLRECETLLKNFYNITDDKLYIKILDIIQDKKRIPKILI